MKEIARAINEIQSISGRNDKIQELNAYENYKAVAFNFKKVAFNNIKDTDYIYIMDKRQFV